MSDAARPPQREALGDAPLYLGGAESSLDLRGRTTTAGERARPGAIAAVVLTVVAAAALAIAYRRLHARARVEEAEAILREEYERASR